MIYYKNVSYIKKLLNFPLKSFRKNVNVFTNHELFSGCENFLTELSIFAEIFSYTELRIQCIKH